MTSDLSLEHHLAPLRRYWRVIAGLGLAGALAGMAAALLGSTTYEASAGILVAPISSDPIEGIGTTIAEIDIDTEIAVAGSVPVTTRAIELMGAAAPTDDPVAFGSHIRARPGRGSRLLTIDFSAADPEQARLGAAAVAEAYLAYRTELVDQQLSTIRTQLEGPIAELETELSAVREQLARLGETDSDRFALEAREQSLTDAIEAPRRVLAELSTIVAGTGFVIAEPTAPTAPSGLGTVPLVAGGLLAGLTAGVAVATALGALRRGSDGTAPAEATAHVAPAVSVPTVPAPAPAEPMPAWAIEEVQPAEPTWTTESPTPVPAPAPPVAPLRPAATTTSPPPGPATRAPSPVPTPAPAPTVEASWGTPTAPVLPSGAIDVDAISTKVRSRLESGARVILVGDAGPGAAAGAVAFALGRQLAGAGLRTIVVDVDFAQPTLARLAHIEPHPGLGQALTGALPPSQAIRPYAEQPNLHVCPAGAGTAALLTNAAVRDLLDALRTQYHAVLLVAGRLPGSPMLQGSAPAPDAVVLATTASADPAALDQDALREVISSLRPLLGAVSTAAVLAGR
jgi:Mrp family chromosome partitioning ATPase